MFTGIVEALGTLKAVEARGDNLVFSIASPISHALREDQSVSHNGACLTVLRSDGDAHQVEAVAETLKKTNLRQLQAGAPVNLERALTLEGRLDGHLVQGHVDTTAICRKRQDQDGSILFRFGFPEKFAALVIEKGAIAINGVSLTVFDVTQEAFSVAVIPYTLSHTNLATLSIGQEVNVEFDLIGKYVLRARDLA